MQYELTNKIIYKDSEKIFYLDKSETNLILSYTNYLLLSDGKTIQLNGKKKLFSSIADFFFNLLKNYNLPINYVSKKENNDLIFSRCSLYPFYLIVRNSIDERTAKIFNRKENEKLSLPIIEFKYGNNEDNFIAESHILALNLAAPYDAKIIKRLASKVNAVLKSFFERRNAYLNEFQIGFGKNDNKIFIAQDFTPSNVIIEYDKGLFSRRQIFSNEKIAKDYIKFFSNKLKNLWSQNTDLTFLLFLHY